MSDADQHNIVAYVKEWLKFIAKDEIEFITVAIPSLCFAILFTATLSIWLWVTMDWTDLDLKAILDLEKIPKPIQGLVYFALSIIIFLLSAAIFLIISFFSHYMANPLYRVVRANQEYKKQNSCYQRLKNANLIVDIPDLERRFYDFLGELKKIDPSVAARAEKFETKSKLARTLCFSFLVGAILFVVLGYREFWLVSVAFGVLSVVMFFIFCQWRWQALSDVCEAIYKHADCHGLPSVRQ